MKRLLTILVVFLISTAIKAQSTQNYLLGDVNRDGKVTVADVMMVVDYLKGDEWLENFDYDNADVNGDQSVSVSDVMNIVGIIIGK